MAQIATIKLDKTWVKLEEAIAEVVTGFTFDSTKTYQIETRGNSPAYFLEADAKPTDESNTDGIQLDSLGFKIILYKVGTSQELYARALISDIVNITTIGE